MQKTDKIQWIALTIGAILLAVITISGLHINETVTKLNKVKAKQHELAQIVEDEGLRLCKYKDSLGYYTVGFGHLLTKEDKLPNCITTKVAVELLRADYDNAERIVTKKSPWAEGEVRLVLVNMTYQMGGRLDKFEKFLAATKAKDYDLATAEMLDSKWAKQASKRAQRLAGRMMQISE